MEVRIRGCWGSSLMGPKGVGTGKAEDALDLVSLFAPSLGPPASPADCVSPGSPGLNGAAASCRGLLSRLHQVPGELSASGAGQRAFSLPPQSRGHPNLFPTPTLARNQQTLELWLLSGGYRW